MVLANLHLSSSLKLFVTCPSSASLRSPICFCLQSGQWKCHRNSKQCIQDTKGQSQLLLS